MNYAYVIEQGKDGSYFAYAPYLHGCTSSADSTPELRTRISDAVEVYLESLRENNETVPAAGSMVGTAEAA